jgi:tetratricopeptide (TPR) repeat protein
MALSPLHSLAHSLLVSLPPPSIFYRRGLSYYFGRRYQHALADLLEASPGLSPSSTTAASSATEPVAEASSLPNCLYHIGLCYSCLHEYPKAVFWFTKAIEESCVYAPFVHERAKALQMTERFDGLLCSASSLPLSVLLVALCFLSLSPSPLLSHS